jgi:DNA-binding MarR family transcriptional regulator
MDEGGSRAELIAALEQLHHPIMVKQFPRLAGKMHGVELSFSQLVAVSVVGNEGPCTITKIAAKVDLSHTATSRMVDRLVNAGLLKRSEDPTDRRQKRIEVTAKGAAFLPEVRSASIEAYNELLATVPDELADRLLVLLRELEPYLQSFQWPDTGFPDTHPNRRGTKS